MARPRDPTRRQSYDEGQTTTRSPLKVSVSKSSVANDETEAGPLVQERTDLTDKAGKSNLDRTSSDHPSEEMNQGKRRNKRREKVVKSSKASDPPKNNSSERSSYNMTQTPVEEYIDESVLRTILKIELFPSVAGRVDENSAHTKPAVFRCDFRRLSTLVPGRLDNLTIRHFCDMILEYK
jgi:hypothetical protein